MTIAEGVTRMDGMEDSNGTELSGCQIRDICELGDELAIIAQNLTEDCQQMSNQKLPMPFMTFIQICYAIICVVGLCGNSLVIFVVLRYSKMQTVTNIYILMLAVADECFLLGLPFLIVTAVHHDWVFGMAMCKIYQTTTAINQFTSSIFLTVMSADRYIAVCHPISSPKFRTPVIARVVSLTAWTCSALLMVPVFMYASTITKQCGGQTCNIFWPFGEIDDDNATMIEEAPSIATTTLPTVNETYDTNENLNETEQYPTVLNGQTAFTFYSFFLGFAIPLGLILVFYILVIFKLKTVGPKNKSKEKKKSHRKVTRLVLTVITVYICCWLPYWITQLALIFTPPGRTQENVMIAIFLLAGCLSYSNSAMNPVLYAFLSENFKKSFLKACQCAAGREVNDALQVEHSVFPRRRTLAGMRASVKDAKNAAVSRMQKLRDRRRRKEYDNNGEVIHHHHRNGSNRGHHHDRIEDDELERQELNDMSSTSQGNISRTTRSCYNSSACPTAMTAASASASVVDDRSTCGISSVTFNDVKVVIGEGSNSDSANGNAVTTTAMVNGSLAPPSML